LNESQQRPKISIVTPTYNSALYLEQTIQSILQQNYPSLEYIVIDGGSNDGTVEIIKRYAERITYWVSEPDGGMYHAIQKGFDLSTGAIMAWLNSDDLYFNWTLDTISRLFNQFEDVEWLTTNISFGIDEKGRPVYSSQLPGYSAKGYLAGEHLPTEKRNFVVEYILQESTFWRRSLWEKSGGRLDTTYKYAGDSELWFRFFKHAQLYDVSLPLGQFRMHDEQITTALRTEYDDEVEAVMRQYGVNGHGRIKAWFRQVASQYTPQKLRRIANRLGLLQRSHRIKYHVPIKQWVVRENYY
jgi:glycosyltransferase involved in cell wall biosynthesis